MANASRLNRASLLGAMALSASLVAGCSSSSNGGGGGGNTGGGGGGVSCALASASDADTALGVSGFAAPSATTSAPVTLCQYDNPTTKRELLIRYQTGMTSSDFGVGEQGFVDHGEPTTPVTDIGDQAYSSSLGSGASAVNTLVVLKGSTEVEISAAVDVAHIEALARLILGKI